MLPTNIEFFFGVDDVVFESFELLSPASTGGDFDVDVINGCILTAQTTQTTYTDGKL